MLDSQGTGGFDLESNKLLCWLQLRGASTRLGVHVTSSLPLVQLTARPQGSIITAPGKSWLTSHQPSNQALCNVILKNEKNIHLHCRVSGLENTPNHKGSTVCNGRKQNQPKKIFIEKIIKQITNHSFSGILGSNLFLKTEIIFWKPCMVTDIK